MRLCKSSSARVCDSITDLGFSLFPSSSSSSGLKVYVGWPCVLVIVVFHVFGIVLLSF